VANDISSNPWKLDTAATVYSFPVRIKSVIWANFTATGQNLVIRDINGKDIVNMKTTTSLTSQLVTPEIGWVRGLVVATIDAGEVTIAISAGK
jgi:hypothetical protein